MALGAAMATGKPYPYIVVPGPGFLNSTGALCTAYACNAPVLALTGQIPQATIGRGLGMLHELPDQLGVMERLAKYAARIRAPHDAPHIMNEAFRQLRSGRPRPVALECPPDVWPKRAAMDFPPAAAAEHGSIDPDAIEAAAKLLGAAEKPLIVVGGGAMEAGAELLEMAEMLQAPIGYHRSGIGVIDGRNPWSVSVLPQQKLWGDCDVVLVVGTRAAASADEFRRRCGPEDHPHRCRSGRDRPHPPAGRRHRRRCGAGAARADRCAGQAQQETRLAPRRDRGA